jgi:uncharacterized integral membrane protein
MPDIESDRSASKSNLLVDRGLRTGTMVALLATALATIFLFTIAYTGVLSTTVDFWYLAWFSFLPLAIAGYGAIRDLRQRSQVLSQVKLNFVGIMSFLLFFITVSVASVWSY